MDNFEENEEQDFDEFQDAVDVEPIPEDMTLEKAVDEAEKAIYYFFNNEFVKAREIMIPYSNSSMYHSIGNAVFCFLEAILTFEHRHIKQAADALKKSMAVCDKFRKKHSIGKSIEKMVKKINYEQYTDSEAHAELCYAESYLLKAALTFMEDETLSTFIKAGLKIRLCYSSYRECYNILLNRSWNNSTTKPHFESGVRMGIGAFNLMISLLPTRVIRLLEFIGFSGNKELGLEDLKKGYQIEGLRQILCLMTLLGYNLIVLYVLSHQEGDLNLCTSILDSQLSKHPNGAWFLFFKGRLEFMKGNFEESKSNYIKSWKSQDIWPQFHHLCFWELLWLHCVKCEWKSAYEYATYLVQNSRWSTTIYSYQKAIIMCMMNDNENEKSAIEELLKKVPKYKQRIAGKSLPMEKFAIKKSERYFNQNNYLVLPIIELMLLWNLFKILKTNFRVAEQILKLIEREEKVFESKAPDKYVYDNKALLLFLKGACLRQMNSPLQALDCLESAISMKKNLIEDHYIIPYSIVELGLMEYENGNKEKAILALEDAKKNYSGYSLESRLHFKIHTALSEFKGKS